MAFLLQLSSRVNVLIYYQINKDYIAKNLCEKKDEPESCCEGSCHLSKELIKIEEQENPNPINQGNKNVKTEELPLFFVWTSYQLRFAFKDVKTSSSDSDKTQKGFTKANFRPPRT